MNFYKFQILIILILTTISSVYAETKCIAHRGFHQNAPENSIESIKAAEMIGADGIELDIVHTKDGYPIIMHDKKLKRTATHAGTNICNTDKKIKKLLLNEVLENCKLRDQSNIPTLRDALEILEQSNMLVFLELKDKPTLKTKKLIQQYFSNSPERLRIISFKARFFDHLKKVSSNNMIFWNQVKFLKLKVFPWGLKKDYGYNICLATYKKKRKLMSNMNQEVSVWTANNSKDIKLLIKDDIDFITTDNTELCLELKNKNRS